jgi:pimeloyl-ACP methyl ester carboxylesterase
MRNAVARLKRPSVPRITFDSDHTTPDRRCDRKGGFMRHNAWRMGSGGQPAVVLVHGAFSDASIWWGVIAELRAHGIADVIAPAVPLRGLSSDAAYVESISNRFTAGPVLFVGHSYGGAVAGAAAAKSEHAVGLVYVAGFALDVGESTSSAGAGFAQSELAASVVPVPYRTESGTSEIDLFLRQDAFARLFAADVPDVMTSAMAVSQRPVTAAALDEPAATAAWKELPSWFAVATDDRLLDPQLQRLMANRAGSEIIESAGSHALPVSQPAAVGSLVLAALGAR